MVGPSVSCAVLFFDCDFVVEIMVMLLVLVLLWVMSFSC